MEVTEMTPSEFLSWFTGSLVSDLDVVVCEDWILNPKKAHLLAGSRMPTSKLIGKIELLIDLRNRCMPQVEFEMAAPHDPRKASVPAAKVLEKIGTTFLSPANPDHMRSAELHGWRWLVKNKLVAGLSIR